MNIEFELSNDKQSINIISANEGKRKEIGNIFTPAGTSHNIKNAIQICGFDEAFDFWGCGIFGDKKTQLMKKDIQLMFSDYDKLEQGERGEVIVKEIKHTFPKDFPEAMKKYHPEGYIIEQVKRNRYSLTKDNCFACYNIPCTCEVKELKVFPILDNPYIIKRANDLKLEVEKNEW